MFCVPLNVVLLATPGGTPFPGTVVSGVHEIFSGGLARGRQTVESGGEAIDTTVSSGGSEPVLAGGLDSGATVSDGGVQEVFGSAVATLILTSSWSSPAASPATRS